MTQLLAERDERLPMASVGMASGSAGAKIAPQNLSEVVKFAEVMCRADIALPQHLRGNAGACMAVSLQALDWQMNPFAVASKSYAVGGRIAYEAQLIVAVVNTRSGIEGRIKYRFEGEGAERVCIAIGKLDGEELEVRSPKYKDITPKNSPLWKSDPDQQQCYYTGRSWARRYTPEVILGVYDRDELEEHRGPDSAKDITPKSSLSDRLALAREATQQPQDAQEGFDAAHVARETSDALTGEILEPDTNGSSPPVDATADAPSASQEDGGSAASVPPSSPLPAELRQHLMDFARKATKTVADKELDDSAKLETIDDMLVNYREVIAEEHWPKLSTIKISMHAVMTGKRSVEQARKFIASDLLDCSVEEIGG